MDAVRTVEGMEEYQRVATNVGKGLHVIKEELHRMRMATKAQVDSLAVQREVRIQSHLTGGTVLCLFTVELMNGSQSYRFDLAPLWAQTLMTVNCMVVEFILSKYIIVMFREIFIYNFFNSFKHLRYPRDVSKENLKRKFAFSYCPDLNHGLLSFQHVLVLACKPSTHIHSTSLSQSL